MLLDAGASESTGFEAEASDFLMYPRESNSFASGPNQADIFSRATTSSMNLSSCRRDRNARLRLHLAQQQVAEVVTGRNLAIKEIKSYATDTRRHIHS